MSSVLIQDVKKNSKKATIRDVAKEAGVSPALVSRVINNVGSVRLETHRAVQKVIERLNYTPDTRGRGVNPSAKGRKKRRTRRIVFLNVGGKGGTTPPIYADLTSGIESNLTASKQNMILKKVVTDAEIIDALSGITFDGIIFSGSLKSKKAIQYMKQFPCVQVMGLFETDSFWDHVVYDNSAIGQIAAEYLLEKGHKCCGMLNYDNEKELFDQRVDNFRDTFEKEGGKAIDLTVETTGEGWKYPIDKIVKNKEQMTAVFGTADILTCFLYPQLIDRGIQLERTFEFVSCNNEWARIETLFPKPSEIDLNIPQLARKSVQQLLWRIENPSEAREKIMVDVKLVTSEELNQRTNLYQNSLVG